MKAEHSFGKLKVANTVKEDASFILTNKNGGFCFLSPIIKSRYQGLFFKENGQVMKTVESFLIADNVVKEIINKFSHAELIRENKVKESFTYVLNTNSLLYELSQPTKVELILDCKRIFDNSSFGRYYTITKEADQIIIEFNKRNDEKEKSGEEYAIFLVIKTDAQNLDTVALFNHYYYESDGERQSVPFDRFRYHALNIECSYMVITQGLDKSKALQENIEVAKKINAYKKNQVLYYQNLVSPVITKPWFSKIKQKNLQMAYLCALASLDGLADDQGIYAGIPWFLQKWCRDELISLKALYHHERFGLIKSVINKRLHMIQEDGRLPNQDPPTQLTSADAFGWLCLRFYEFIKVLEKKKMLDRVYTREEINEIVVRLKDAMKDLYIKYHDEGLIYNNDLETWMDSSSQSDTRSGYRIEIQALILRSLHVLHILSQNLNLKKWENDLWQHTVVSFWNHLLLKDGKDDETQRPNIFIAYYVYPKMLYKDEWITAFDTALLSLSQPWGGLSTIDPSNPLFQPMYTGEDNRSYHRGDVWYWVNNLAAISMYRLNKEHYKERINKILDASINDLLWQGALGHASELSSAIEQKPAGCLAQAWSSALFIELVEEIFGK